MLHIDAKPIDLKLTTPFRISRGVQNTSPNVVVQVQYNEHVGYGEAAQLLMSITVRTRRRCYHALQLLQATWAMTRF